MAYSKFKQGTYRPVNAAKYIGQGLPTYRSGMEMKFMVWCDRNPNVIKWGSENVIVPYKSPLDHRMHRYFVDNFVMIKEGEKLKRYLIEIKPDCQTRPPNKHGNKKQSTILYEECQYKVNTEKWKQAREFAKNQGWEFLIITEKDLP